MRDFHQRRPRHSEASPVPGAESWVCRQAGLGPSGRPRWLVAPGWHSGESTEKQQRPCRDLHSWPLLPLPVATGQGAPLVWAGWNLGGFLQWTKAHLPSLHLRRLPFPPVLNYLFVKSRSGSAPWHPRLKYPSAENEENKMNGAVPK